MITRSDHLFARQCSFMAYRLSYLNQTANWAASTPRQYLSSMVTFDLGSHAVKNISRVSLTLSLLEFSGLQLLTLRKYDAVCC